MKDYLWYLGALLVLVGLVGNRLRWSWPGWDNRKLVRFPDGKWGVRYGWVYHTWRDFQCPQYTWGTRSEFFRDCQTSEANARRYMVGGSNYEIVGGQR